MKPTQARVNVMSVNFQPRSMDVIIVHTVGFSLSEAHASARTVRGVRLLSTFVDGWGRTVTMAIASNL